MCDSGCYSGPRMMCGKAMTAGEVPEQILSDKPYPWDGFYGQMGAAFFRRDAKEHRFINLLRFVVEKGFSPFGML